MGDRKVALTLVCEVAVLSLAPTLSSTPVEVALLNWEVLELMVPTEPGEPNAVPVLFAEALSEGPPVPVRVPVLAPLFGVGMGVPEPSELSFPGVGFRRALELEEGAVALELACIDMDDLPLLLCSRSSIRFSK